MSFLALLLLGQASPAKAILDRYTQYRKLHPAFSADWNLTGGGQSIAQGTLMLDGSKRLLFKATSETESYSLSESEKGVVELKPSAEMYDEFPPLPYVFVPPSKLGNGTSFIPVPLMEMAAFAPGLKYTVEPPTMVGGQKADVVSWTVVVQMVPIRYSLALAADGRIFRVTRGRGQGGPGGRPGGGPSVGPSSGPSGGQGGAPASQQNAGWTWTISNYRPIAHTTLTAFLTPIPRGFVPISMPPESDILIQVDQSFPTVAWKTASSTLDLKSVAGGKPEVVLITAPDCAPSRKALASLPKIEAGLPGLRFEPVSLARSSSDAHGLPYDASGQASMAIGETSTPLFVLMDGSGKIRNLWAGFDPDGITKFSKELSEAVKNLTAPH